MAFYLRCDGVDDYIWLPSMTVQRIEVDGIIYAATKDWESIFDARTGVTNGQIQHTTGPGYALNYPGGTMAPINPTWGTRETTVFRRTDNAEFTDDVLFFTYTDGLTAGYNKRADVWSITCYNAANAVVARYDMSTQTVQDQSGNGRHAALSGGTWLDDGAGGGGGTTYNQTVGSATVTPSSVVGKALSLQKSVGQSTITPTGSLSQNIAGLAISAGRAILTPIGSLAKRTYKGVGGVVASVGNAAKGLFKTVGGGTVNPTGTVSSQLNPEPPSSVGRTVINWVMKGLKNFFD